MFAQLGEVFRRITGRTARPAAIRTNEIIVIRPYMALGIWVFDDPRVGLVQEPFVSGADTMIDRFVASIPNAEKGFNLIFARFPFPGHQLRLEWRRTEGTGNWYYSPDLDMEGWLCPALLRYFAQAPKQIYVQAKDMEPDSKLAS